MSWRGKKECAPPVGTLATSVSSVMSLKQQWMRNKPLLVRTTRGRLSLAEVESFQVVPLMAGWMRTFNHCKVEAPMTVTG